MTSYFPGRGLKKPLNNLQNPIAPDIRQAPPRFIWTKKHWQVDTGRTMAEVEHIPQLQEAAVLYQSYDYGSQHAYGKQPTYTAVVNKEFRPPLLDRDDLLPLSRIPRPVIIPHINPGGAHPSGNNSFSDQNINIPGVEKYLTNRVKQGEMRPTFFAPIDMPADNSVLPDLEMKLPAHSAGAGFKFPTITDTYIAPPIEDTGYDRIHPEMLAGMTPIQLNAADERFNGERQYTRPQVSAGSGRNTFAGAGLTPIEFNLDYKIAQVSADAGYTGQLVTPSQARIENFEYIQPQVSADAGRNTFAGAGLTPIDYDLQEKIPGTLPASAGTNMSNYHTFDSDNHSRIDNNKVRERSRDVQYVVPANTQFHTNEKSNPHFRTKIDSLSNYTPHIHQSPIARKGISTPQVTMGKRKNIN